MCYMLKRVVFGRSVAVLWASARIYDGSSMLVCVCVFVFNLLPAAQRFLWTSLPDISRICASVCNMANNPHHIKVERHITRMARRGAAEPDVVCVCG